MGQSHKRGTVMEQGKKYTRKHDQDPHGFRIYTVIGHKSNGDAVCEVSGFCTLYVVQPCQEGVYQEYKEPKVHTRCLTWYRQPNGQIYTLNTTSVVTPKDMVGGNSFLE